MALSPGLINNNFKELVDYSTINGLGSIQSSRLKGALKSCTKWKIFIDKNEQVKESYIRPKKKKADWLLQLLYNREWEGLIR